MRDAAFESIDVDGSKHLTLEELFKAVERYGLPIPLPHLNEIFFQLLDQNSDGKVSYLEFVNSLQRWNA